MASQRVSLIIACRSGCIRVRFRSYFLALAQDQLPGVAAKTVFSYHSSGKFKGICDAAATSMAKSSAVLVFSGYYFEGCCHTAKDLARFIRGLKGRAALALLSKKRGGTVRLRKRRIHADIAGVWPGDYSEFRDLVIQAIALVTTK